MYLKEECQIYLSQKLLIFQNNCGFTLFTESWSQLPLWISQVWEHMGFTSALLFIIQSGRRYYDTSLWTKIGINNFKVLVNKMNWWFTNRFFYIWCFIIIHTCWFILDIWDPLLMFKKKRCFVWFILQSSKGREHKKVLTSD